MDKSNIPSTFHPNLKDFSSLKQYLVEDKEARNALQQHGAVKIIAPKDWNYKFNTSVLDTVFTGNNTLLSLTNIELIDKLSFKRFFDLFLKLENLHGDTLAEDLNFCATKFGVNLYKLYKVHYRSTLKLTDKNEQLRETCSTLGINADFQEKLKEIVEKYLDKFQAFLYSDNKDLNLNSPATLSRHFNLLKAIHTSKPPTVKSDRRKSHPPEPPTAIQPSSAVVDSLLKSNRWNRLEKLKLISQQYQKRAIHIKQGTRGTPSVDSYFKKTRGRRKSNGGRVQKSKHASTDTGGVRSTRSMLRRLSAPEPTNGTEDDKSDSPELSSDSPSCRACGLTDVPRSQLRHCSACDVYSHAACSGTLPSGTDSNHESSTTQWECPICFSTNWLRGFAPAVTIPEGKKAGGVFDMLVQHENAMRRHFCLAQENGSANFLEHFWQVVQYGGRKHGDITVYHASANQVSGFVQGSPGCDQFSASVLQGDAEDSSVPDLSVNRVCMDSIYSTQGFRQEAYAAPCMHFIHRGASKTWYVVRDCAQFGTLLKTESPGLFSPPRHNEGLLGHVPLCVHPEDLLTHSVGVSVFTQSEGEVVLFSPGVVKCYVSHGASLSETAVLPLPQWVPAMGRYFRRTRHPHLQVSRGHLLTSLVHASLFSLPLRWAHLLYSAYTRLIGEELRARREWISSGAVLEPGTEKLFQEARCAVCAQKLFLTGFQWRSSVFCLAHQPRVPGEKKKEVKLYVSQSSRQVEKGLKSLARRFNIYDQFAQSVILLQDIRKKPDTSDLQELLATAQKHKFTQNLYYQHLESNEQWGREFQLRTSGQDLNELSLPVLHELHALASLSDFLLPGEAQLAALLASDREPRLLLSLYAQGRLDLARLRARVKTLEAARPLNRVNLASFETLDECIRIGSLLEEITQSIQHLHSCDEEKVEELIEQSQALPASPELEVCVTILREVLEERVEWKNRALDLLDTEEARAPLSEWVEVEERGRHIHDYDVIKAQLHEQISRAREFEKVARSIVLYDESSETPQPLTHDVEEIATLLEDAEKHIHVKLDTYELLSKEHKDAGIWLRLADLCFLWPQSELEIISILMPKTFNPALSPWLLPLVPGGRRGPSGPPGPPRPCINTVLGELLAQDKREVVRQEYQALLALRSYQETLGKQSDVPKESDNSGGSSVKSPSNVCFCARNIYCSLIFCHLCRSYYHEKCITKALKRREVHNTESNISNLNYKVPANLSALGELDLFVCVKCVWGKRPRLADVKGRIVDVLSEVRLKLPEAIALVHCLQRTLYIQQEIKMYLGSREVVQLKELSEVQRETDRLLQESFVRTQGPSPTPSHSSRSSDDFFHGSNAPSGNHGNGSTSGNHGNGSTSGNHGSAGLHSNGSSRTAGDTLITKQRKHKRKATLIPRIDNDSIAAINREEIKVAGVELLNKGLLNEIHIPELSALLTFIRHMDKEFGYYPKVKMAPPSKKLQVKKAPPPSPVFSSLIGPDSVAPPPPKKLASMKNTGLKVSFPKTPPPPRPGSPSSSSTSPHFPHPPSPATYPPSGPNYPAAPYAPAGSAGYPSSAHYPPSGPIHPAAAGPSSYPPGGSTSYPSPNAPQYAPRPHYTSSAQNFPQNPSSHFPPHPANIPPLSPNYLTGLTAVAEAAMLSAQISPPPPSPPAAPKAHKAAKTPAKPPAAGQRAAKSPGAAAKTPKTPSSGTKLSPGPKPGKSTATTPGVKVPRQRKPRTTPSHSPAGGASKKVSSGGAPESTMLAPSAAIVTPPAPSGLPRKKKKKEKFEFCDLEDCLEPEGEIDWVQCDRCERWFHFICVGLSTISKDEPYLCTYCVNTINSIKMDSADTEANENEAVSSLLSLSRGLI